MLRIVPDTNVLLSALLVEGNERLLIEKCFCRDFQLVISLDILDEFKEVALRPKFGFSVEELDEFINALVLVSDVVVPAEKVKGVCRDVDDEKFLEAALEGKADWVVSGDKDLLVLGRFRNIIIGSASDFVMELGGG